MKRIGILIAWTATAAVSATGTALGQQVPQAKPPDRPAVNVVKAAPAGAAEAGAAALLLSKGLRPDGPMYLLAKEDKIRALVIKLQVMAQEIESIVLQTHQQVIAADGIQTAIAMLRDQQMALASAPGSKQPTNIYSWSAHRRSSAEPRAEGASRESYGAYPMPAGAVAPGSIPEFKIAHDNIINPGPQSNPQREANQGNANREAIRELREHVEKEKEHRQEAKEKGNGRPQECGAGDDGQDGAAECAPGNMTLIAKLEVSIERYWFQLMQAEITCIRLGQAALMKTIAFNRARDDLGLLVAELRQRYRELNNDAEVTAALITLNEGSPIRHALGPAEAYEENLKALAKKVLLSNGFLATRRGGFILGVDQDVLDLIECTRVYRYALVTALEKQRDTQKDLDKKRHDLAFSRKDKDRALYQEKIAADEKQLKSNSVLIANLRQAFVQCVGNLDVGLNQSAQKREELENKPGVKEAFGDLATTRDPRVRKPENKRYLYPDFNPLRKELQVYKKDIKTSSVPLEADKAAPRMSADINGSRGVKLVVDPAEPMVRVSARVAKTIGLVADKGAAPLSVTMSDGQQLSAQSATINSIKSGPHTVTNVPCQIVLDDYDGPSVLGASFLDRFVYRFDPDANTLTLTTVDIALPKGHKN
jgi:hypothetical protein